MEVQVGDMTCFSLIFHFSLHIIKADKLLSIWYSNYANVRVLAEKRNTNTKRRDLMNVLKILFETLFKDQLVVRRM